MIRRLKSRNGLVGDYNQISDKFNGILFRLSPFLLVEYLYLKEKRKRLNLKNPKLFDEKLLWLMLYWRHPLKTRCADKYAVRSYVEERGWGHILPELLGVYESSSQIDFTKLPQWYVLKCTHGCGFNILCKDRSNLDTEETKRKLDVWMKVDISKLAGEVHYASIKPQIICEAYLEDPSGKPPIDYKVFCFNGKAHCTMACTERGSGTTKFDFYDRDWRNKLPYSKSSLLANRSIPRPEAYDEMIAAAERLSEPFPFVRMDFYNIKGRVLLGEMTFTPNGCIDTGFTDMAQEVMGKLIKLPDKYREPGS